MVKMMKNQQNTPARPFISEGDKHLFRTLWIFAKMLACVAIVGAAALFLGWLALIPAALGAMFFVASEKAKKKT